MKLSLRPLSLAIFLFLVTVSPSPCQVRSGTTNDKTLVIRVVTEDDRPVGSGVKVKLITPSEVGMYQEVFTDSTGQAMISGLFPGDYKVHLSGLNIQEATSSSFTIGTSERQHSEIVYVKRTKIQEGTEAAGGPRTVSAAELNIPKSAQKEFEKGRDAMEKGSPEAKRHFERALELYPQYAAALNNLGVLSMQSKDPEEAHKYFQRAITVDPHLANAQLNLARLAQQSGDMKQVEQFAQKAADADAENSEALLLLANSQLANNEPAGAISSVKKLHELPHQQYAAAHLIAARAYEMQKQAPDAIIEYKIFLREAPTHPSAAKAQAAIDRLQKPQE